jgi:hypothetical protein
MSVGAPAAIGQAVEQARYESEAFIHLVTLLPRHFALPQRPEMLPMSSV